MEPARPVDPAVDLLQRAAADGHTWLPAGLVEPVVDRAALGAAVGAGTVVRVPAGPDHGYALAGVAEEEELLADALRALAAHGRVAVCLGAPDQARAAAISELADQAVARGLRVSVVADAERLGLAAAVELLEDLAEEALLLLAGDPQALPAAGPGAVLADLAAAGICAVVPVGPALGPAGAGGAAVSGPQALAAALRTGLLPAPGLPDVVVVPVRDDAEAVHRVGQVVTVSLPRALGLAGADVAVLTPLRSGVAGVRALAAALGADADADAASNPASAFVGTVHEAVGRTWPAVVLVLPGQAAGVLARDLLVSAVSAATRHLTVVHGAGPDLALAVATRPHRPRRTRLVGLLREGIGAVPS